MPVDRLPRQRDARERKPSGWRAFQQGLSETGFVEGQNVVDRVPLRQKVNPTGCLSWRADLVRPSGRRTRRDWSTGLGARRQAGDHDDPDRIC